MSRKLLPILALGIALAVTFISCSLVLANVGGLVQGMVDSREFSATNTTFRDLSSSEGIYKVTVYGASGSFPQACFSIPSGNPPQSYEVSTFGSSRNTAAGICMSMRTGKEKAIYMDEGTVVIDSIDLSRERITGRIIDAAAFDGSCSISGPFEAILSD